MKKIAVAAALFLSIFGLSAVAHADLNGFISSLNVQARTDLHGFSVKLGAQFGIPVPQVQAIINTVESPADAFMCLQLGQMAHQQPETVVQTYMANKGKGWGVIAKNLGIKPGSAEFHALKRGDLSFTGEPGAGEGQKGQGKGKGKGRGKGHN
jgi:hypothetical protein